MDLYGELEWRGLVYDATEGVRDAAGARAVTGYIGFDPTAASLHVGIAAVDHGAGARCSGRALADRAGRRRHRADRRSERQDGRAALLTPSRSQANVDGIRAQLARFLDFDERAPIPRGSSTTPTG